MRLSLSLSLSLSLARSNTRTHTRTNMDQWFRSHWHTHTQVLRVVAPSGEKSRAMRKSIIKLFLSEADSLLTRVSAVQGLVQDCLALQQEV